MAKKKQVYYRLIEIKELSSFMHSLQELGIDDYKLSKVKYQRDLTFDFNEKEGEIDIIVDIKFFYNVDSKNTVDLFGIRTLTKFGLKDYKDSIKWVEKNLLDIPDNLMYTFFSVAYSSSRGILVCLTSKTDYDNFYLPLIELKEIKEQFLAKKK
ncbi:hypothetical protein ACFLS4_03855 [Bacteroidota bacterium]